MVEWMAAVAAVVVMVVMMVAAVKTQPPLPWSFKNSRGFVGIGLGVEKLISGYRNCCS